MAEVKKRPGSVTTAAPSDMPAAIVVSDPSVQYVASDTQYPYFAVDRALPQSVDDAERKYGPGVYDKMLAEPMLAACDHIIKILVLADGVTITPSHPEPPKTKATAEQKADYAKSTELADYVRYVLERLDDKDAPLLDTLYNLLDGARLGHKLAETTFDTITEGEYAGKAGIASLRCKPRSAYAFVCDSMNTFRGVVAKIPGKSILIWQGIIFDLAQMANAVDPDKLVVFTMETEDGDPRGKSWWRACYDPWYQKQKLKPEALNTGIQFGGGKVSVELPPNANDLTFPDPENPSLRVSMYEAVRRAIRRWVNGGGLILPSGAKVTLYQPPASLTFFDSQFNRLDREMVTAFLLSARSILEAKHSSKADSDSAQDLVDELKMFIRARLCRVLKNKVVKVLLRMTYPPEIVAKYCPNVVMAKASRPDFAANATAVAALNTSGYIAPSQKPSIDSEILGLAAREPGELDDTTDDVEESDDGGLETSANNDGAGAGGNGGDRSLKPGSSSKSANGGGPPAKKPSGKFQRSAKRRPVAGLVSRIVSHRV